MPVLYWSGIFFTNLKKNNMFIIGLFIGFVIGVIIDNRYAPKVKKVDGKITLEWSEKKKTV